MRSTLKDTRGAKRTITAIITAAGAVVGGDPGVTVAKTATGVYNVRLPGPGRMIAPVSAILNEQIARGVATGSYDYAARTFNVLTFIPSTLAAEDRGFTVTAEVREF